MFATFELCLLACRSISWLPSSYLPKPRIRFWDRATAKGDTVEILDVANGSHFDIIAPVTKVWAEAETFILDHAFNQKPQAP
jgi:hypothetical protein